MSRDGMDQAAGLRRLLARNSVRLVAIAGGGVGIGKTSTVVNVAAALAHEGNEVLLLDANSGPGSVADVLGIERATDLDAALQRGQPMQGSVAPGPDGIWLMPAAEGLARIARMEETQRRRALAAIADFARPMDVMLVDVAGPESAELLGSVADDMLVVLSTGAESVTDAYALIKRLKFAAARNDFTVVVNRVASESSARAMFENIARVASRYLGVTLTYGGFVPPDERVARASRLRRSVVDAYPAASASASYRRVAGGLHERRRTPPVTEARRGTVAKTAQAVAHSHGVPCIQ